VRIEILPRAGDDIVRQFRYYLVEQDAPAAAFRFREAVIESIHQQIDAAHKVNAQGVNGEVDQRDVLEGRIQARPLNSAT